MASMAAAPRLVEYSDSSDEDEDASSAMETSEWHAFRSRHLTFRMDAAMGVGVCAGISAGMPRGVRADMGAARAWPHRDAGDEHMDVELDEADAAASATSASVSAPESIPVPVSASARASASASVSTSASTRMFTMQTPRIGRKRTPPQSPAAEQDRDAAASPPTSSSSSPMSDAELEVPRSDGAFPRAGMTTQLSGNDNAGPPQATEQTVKQPSQKDLHRAAKRRGSWKAGARAGLFVFGSGEAAMDVAASPARTRSARNYLASPMDVEDEVPPRNVKIEMEMPPLGPSFRRHRVKHDLVDSVSSSDTFVGESMDLEANVPANVGSDRTEAVREAVKATSFFPVSSPTESSNAEDDLPTFVPRSAAPASSSQDADMGRAGTPSGKQAPLFRSTAFAAASVFHDCKRWKHSEAKGGEGFTGFRSGVFAMGSSSSEAQRQRRRRKHKMGSATRDNGFGRPFPSSTPPQFSFPPSASTIRSATESPEPDSPPSSISSAEDKETGGAFQTSTNDAEDESKPFWSPPNLFATQKVDDDTDEFGVSFGDARFLQEDDFPATNADFGREPSTETSDPSQDAAQEHKSEPEPTPPVDNLESNFDVFGLDQFGASIKSSTPSRLRKSKSQYAFGPAKHRSLRRSRSDLIGGKKTPAVPGGLDDDSRKKAPAPVPPTANPFTAAFMGRFDIPSSGANDAHTKVRSSPFAPMPTATKIPKGEASPFSSASGFAPDAEHFAGHPRSSFTPSTKFSFGSKPPSSSVTSEATAAAAASPFLKFPLLFTKTERASQSQQSFAFAPDAEHFGGQPRSTSSTHSDTGKTTSSTRHPSVFASGDSKSEKKFSGGAFSSPFVFEPSQSHFEGQVRNSNSKRSEQSSVFKTGSGKDGKKFSSVFTAPFGIFSNGNASADHAGGQAQAKPPPGSGNARPQQASPFGQPFATASTANKKQTPFMFGAGADTFSFGAPPPPSIPHSNAFSGQPHPSFVFGQPGAFRVNKAAPPPPPEVKTKTRDFTVQAKPFSTPPPPPPPGRRILRAVKLSDSANRRQQQQQADEADATAAVDGASEDKHHDWGEWKHHGGVAYASGQYGNAAECYQMSISTLEKLLLAHPELRTDHLMQDKAKLHANRAASLMMLLQFSDAQHECELSVEMDPSYTRAYLRLGRIQVMLGDLDGAKQSLVTAKRQLEDVADDDSSDLMQVMKIESAIEQLQKSLAEIKCCLDVCDYSRALMHLDEALRVAQFSRALQTQKAQVLFRQKNYSQVLEYCSGILQKQRSRESSTTPAVRSTAKEKLEHEVASLGIELAVLRISALHYQNKSDEAMQQIVALEDAAPCSEKVIKLRRRMHDMKQMKHAANGHFKKGEFSKARDIYSKAIQLDPDHDEYCAVIYCNRAAALMGMMQYQIALEDCHAALKRKPHYPRALLRRARCLVALKRYALAIKDFDQYLRENGGDSVMQEKWQAQVAMEREIEAKKQQEEQWQKQRQERARNPSGQQSSRRGASHANASSNPRYAWDDTNFGFGGARSSSSSNRWQQSNPFRGWSAKSERGQETNLNTTTSSNRTHYDVLGVQRSATQDQIKKAYRKLALVHHPDKTKDVQQTDLFKDMTAAYNVLSDATARAQYDRDLRYDGFGRYYEC